jgi:hypothetical protein
MRQCAPAQAKKPKCCITQLQRYLVEIVALTLGADFDALNATLYEDKSIVCTNSILSCRERTELLALSRLLLKVVSKVEQKQSPDQLDVHHPHKAVLQPSREIDTGLKNFALDLMGWYSGNISCPILWSETLSRFWETEVKSQGYLSM